ncbi:hypothetical protein QF035_003193 [Streptomyces umbrinus]|uniref:Uncharacterized protein n=1 Tax=Streptomyces umbrinus TaxID=67370 RepID=A0ABU0SQ61_9ACTN|nr:hypothetical protein [Streptomyces umbrinus]MDQ1025611.1 hypothetical protein [Streptomyces umbrinus]
MLTTHATAPSKPSKSSERVGPSKPVGPFKPAEPVALAAPTHVTVTVTGIPGRFAVIRHAVTIPRIPTFRFDLWITTTMITSELVHRLTASFA